MPAPTKLSRLPPRSAIVAFSAEQVYAVAEMLRRMRGGAAVVMGALSPAHPQRPGGDVSRRARSTISSPPTRSAWGSTWTSTHVAFAGLSKFDGAPPAPADPGRDGADRRPRRPPPARRHVRRADAGGRAQRRVPARGDRARSRSIASRRSTISSGARASPTSRSVEALIAIARARGPVRRELRAAPEAIDLAVLKRLAERSGGARRARRRRTWCERLWAACGLPDFRKTGPEHHARLVARLFAI